MNKCLLEITRHIKKAGLYEKDLLEKKSENNSFLSLVKYLFYHI
ncbi:hypothetical protein [Mediterraneibacter gnavus]|jgi:hypothetical protein|nr:hypothetical protein [Mediterraneibacter gnavus]